ncbi:TetR family transcriptional regulator [beta proteobacterium AAP99]|nr:TetR family transcriptional regulator [beta proteobacterium AAP99]
MARERSFSEPEVLQRAADVFSTHGYGATSVAMLCEATGLGKQSLYNAFGDKQALYLKSVDCAVGRFGAAVAAMKAAPDGRAALQSFFDGLVHVCASGEPALKSCIVTTGLLESVDDPALRLSLQAKWQATHELLRGTIERGQKDGSVRNAAPSAELADLLMSLMSGLRVTARVDDSRARLQRSADLAMAMLDHS